MRRLFTPFVLVPLVGIAVAGALRVEPSGAASTDVGTQVTRIVAGIVGYSRWPAAPDSYRLCTAGEIVHFRDTKVPTKLGEHPLVVSQAAIDDAAWTNACDILYLGALPVAQRRRLLAEAVGRPLLTISEGDEVCAEASMFCLSIRGDEVALLANLDAISRSGIRINPRVLQLVRRKQGQP